MAIETTTFDLTPRTFGLTSLPEPALRNSPVPRQELLFDIFNATVPVPGAGDFQNVRVETLLPPGFAYALTDIFLSITGADAADWGISALLELRDGTETGDTSWRIKMESVESFEVAGLATNQCGRGYTWPVLPKRLILPAKAGAEVRASVSNVTVDGAAATCNYSARYLVYDIAQAHHWEVNTPQLVR